MATIYGQRPIMAGLYTYEPLLPDEENEEEENEEEENEEELWARATRPRRHPFQWAISAPSAK
jgi:hypothetical protein